MVGGEGNLFTTSDSVCSYASCLTWLSPHCLLGEKGLRAPACGHWELAMKINLLKVTWQSHPHTPLQVSFCHPHVLAIAGMGGSADPMARDSFLTKSLAPGS